MSCAYVEHYLTDIIITNIAFFGKGKFEPLRLPWRESNFGVRGVELRRKKDERRSRRVTDKECFARSLTDSNILNWFDRRVLTDAASGARADQGQRDERCEGSF